MYAATKNDSKTQVPLFLITIYLLWSISGIFFSSLYKGFEHSKAFLFVFGNAIPTLFIPESKEPGFTVDKLSNRLFKLKKNKQINQHFLRYFCSLTISFLE